MPQIRVPVVGSNYHAGAVDALLGTDLGAPVALIREPGNEHDSCAIRCEAGGVMIGYVPRSHNRAIAAAMDSGLYDVQARLATHPIVSTVAAKQFVKDGARLIVAWE